MSGNSEFTLASALTIGVMEQGEAWQAVSNNDFGAAVTGPEEPSLLGNIWNALAEGLRAGGDAMKKTQAVANNVMQAGSSFLTDMGNKLNDLRIRQQPALGT
jgi:uncharacterized Ntn-hydrolase superfamily protein